jgi:predicted RND superfamily exporter protein
MRDGSLCAHFEETVAITEDGPEVLTRIGSFEEYVRGLKDLTVGGALGPATYVLTANYLAGGSDEKRRVIPDSPDRAEWCWEQYARFRGSSRLRQLIEEGESRGLVTIFLKNANFRDVGKLLDVLHAYERDKLAPYGISLRLGGDVAVSQTLIASIVNTQLVSVTGSLIGIVIVVALFGKSLKWGLLAVLPSALAIELNFAAMGYWGIPLGVATSMFAAMTLGVGVDYALHLVESFRLERERGQPPRVALARTLHFVGAATTVDALAVAAGVGLLVFSQVPANARLGALFVLSLLGCLATTLILLPALLMWGQKTEDPRSKIEDPASKSTV